MRNESIGIELGICGIYCITNSITKKKYVGSSKNKQGGVHARIIFHLSQLRRNIHHNKPLQEDYNACGEEAFTYELLEEVIESNFNRIKGREKYYMEQIDKENRYNVTEVNKTITYNNREELEESLRETARRMEKLFE